MKRERLSEKIDHARADEENEREKMALKLENAMLKFERRYQQANLAKNQKVKNKKSCSAQSKQKFRAPACRFTQTLRDKI